MSLNVLREETISNSYKLPNAKHAIRQSLGHSMDDGLLVVSKVRLRLSARTCRASPSMLREGISSYPLEDPSTKSMISQVLGQSTGHRLFGGIVDAASVLSESMSSQSSQSSQFPRTKSQLFSSTSECKTHDWLSPRTEHGWPTLGVIAGQTGFLIETRSSNSHCIARRQ